MEEIIYLLQAMRAAAVEAALVVMGVLLRPPETLVAAVAADLVEMVEMRPFRPICLAAVVVVVVASDLARR